MSAHPFRCTLCGSWREGAATHASTAPRDRYGRIERDYTGPLYCDDHCRDHAERNYEAQR